MKKYRFLKLIIITLVVGGQIASPAVSFSAEKKVAKANSKSKPLNVDEELKMKPGDEQGNELKSLKAELLISASDNRALAQLQKLLKKYKGTAMEPSFHFRLAELYMRKAKTATFFEVHRDNGNVVRFSPVETKSGGSKAWVNKAVDTYDNIEKRFTHFKDMDLVLFNNAFARQILGQEKPAMARYRRVIDDFPSSPLVPDCHLAIGESLFGNKSFQASYDEFQKIRQYPDSRVYPYGLYKGAWSLYNLRKTGDALKQMEEVIAYSKLSNEEGGPGNRLDLTREALDDMVVFFEDVRSPNEAVSYFRGQGGDARAGDLVLKLGKLYQRHGRFKNLEIVYTDLISAVPTAAERPQMHRDLMDGFDLSRQYDKAVTHLETVSSLCVENSKWALAQKKEDQGECWNLLEESGKHYSSKWHKWLVKHPSKEMGEYTRRSYEALLRHDKRFGNEDKLRFSYAELLFQQSDFRKASVEYSRVAHLTKDAKLKHDGSYGALVSLEKAVGDKWSDRDEREFATLAQDYITMNPKGAYVTDVKFKKAFIAYEKGRYDEAAPQLKNLAVQFSDTERGRKAAHLYLDILNIQKKYEPLRDESLAFAQKLKLDAATKAEFQKIHQQASFTVVQNMEAAGFYTEAVNAYLAFIKEDPRSSFADKALYNAIRCANLANDLVQAAKLSERLIAEYPTSPYKVELTKALVTLYEAQAQLNLASLVLLKLADLEADKKWGYTLAAADYKALSNDWNGAVSSYNRLVEKAPRTHEGQVALERLEAYAEKSNQWGKAQRILEQLVASGMQPQASLANHKLAQKAYDEKNEDKAFKLAKHTISMRGEKKVSAWALAQSRLIQAKILEHEFDLAGVKAKPERLGMVLAIKSEKLEKAQKAFQDVIGFGDRVTAVEALIHLASCYEKFSTALNTIEAPSDAPEADRKKFQKEIENMVVPIEEKNAETLQLALKQAKDLNLRDGTVARIQAELNRLSKRAVPKRLVVELNTPENVLPVVN